MAHDAEWERQQARYRRQAQWGDPSAFPSRPPASPGAYEPTQPFPAPGWGGDAEAGSGGYGTGGGHGRMEGFGEPTYPASPPDPYAQPRYSGGRPPQWPDPHPPAPPQPIYSPPPPQYRQPRAAEPAYAPPAIAPTQREPRAQPRRQSSGIGLPHVPIAHILLLAGLAAMFVAISQQWAVDISGNAIFVSSFTSPQIQHITGVDTSVAATRVAYAIVIVGTVLGAALLLVNAVTTVLNKAIGLVGLGGCASLLFFPVLWGAATLLFFDLLGATGFAGLGFLSGLPVVQAHGLSTLSVAHYSAGWYLWVGGAAAVFVGMLGELVMRRR